MKDAYWIDDPSETRLAIIPRPRGGDWLEDDLLRIKRIGVDIIVSMLTLEEEEELGLSQEQKTAEQLGLRFYSYPILDRSTPTNKDTFQEFVHELVAKIKEGKRVGAHCRGCIGRATLITASILISRGWIADRALISIEAARGCLVPDTVEQRQWIESFSTHIVSLQPGKRYL